VKRLRSVCFVALVAMSALVRSMGPAYAYSAKVTASPTRVYEGETVVAEAIITPSPPAGTTITWFQAPVTPAGTFNPATGSQTNLESASCNNPDKFFHKSLSSV